ncbi:MAG: SEC-C domain-containing protein [Simkaniaceae bacterium]|nr:SEC-C domain-containing protein [Simkaniaceae bacterium]
MISRNDPCYCGSGKKWKKCHYPFQPPKSFASKKEEYFKNYQIILKIYLIFIFPFSWRVG